MEKTTSKTWNLQTLWEEFSPNNNTQEAGPPKAPIIKISSGKSRTMIAGDTVKRTTIIQIIVRERIRPKERRVTLWGRREITSIRGISPNTRLRTRPHLNTIRNTCSNRQRRNTSRNNKNNPRHNLKLF
jgi:hypothetical protein